MSKRNKANDIRQCVLKYILHEFSMYFETYDLALKIGTSGIQTNFKATLHYMLRESQRHHLKILLEFFEEKKLDRKIYTDDILCSRIIGKKIYLNYNHKQINRAHKALEKQEHFTMALTEIGEEVIWQENFMQEIYEPIKTAVTKFITLLETNLKNKYKTELSQKIIKEEIARFKVFLEIK